MASTLSRRTFASLLAAGAVTLAWSQTGLARTAFAEGAFEGGAGTPEDPYQIATAEQLAAVSDDLTASYVLVADVDLADAGNWVPLGHFLYGEQVNMETGEMDMAAAFSGTFDGQGHTVSGLTCTIGEQDMDAGLFGIVTGSVADVAVEAARVAAPVGSMVAGVAVGYNLGGSVTGVTVADSTLQGCNCVGCVVGGNNMGGVIEDCSVTNSTVIVVGSNDFSDGRIVQCDVAECGGLVVGGSFDADVNNCSAQGTVVSVGNEPVALGGLAGCLELTESVTGNTVDARIVTSNAHAVGGLAGFAGNGDDGTGNIGEPTVITGCDVRVAICADGATHVGGLVGTGLYYFGMEGRFAITGCTVSGTIDGAVTPGAIAGRATDSTIEDCVADVLVDGVQATDEVGVTDRMYESADQYEGAE